MRRLIGIVLGALMCIGGVYCLLDPTLAFINLIVVFGFALVGVSIGYFIFYLKLNKLGISSGTLLVNSLLSIVLGLLLICDFFTQIIVENVVVYFIAGYMVFAGISTIMNSFKLKDYLHSSFWIILFIFGVLTFIAGFLSLVNPIVVVISIGVLIAVDMFIVGSSLITVSIFY